MLHKKKSQESKDSFASEGTYATSLSATFAKPCFVLRKQRLSTYKIETRLKQQLIKNYHLALFKSVITALNCDIVEMFASNSQFNKKTLMHPDYLYVRDPVVILHDKKIIISTPDNQPYASKQIIHKVKSLTNYRSIIIDNAYFEGGNVFYFPEKGVLFHGLDPGGHYGSSLPNTFKTNIALEKALNPYHIKVQGLHVNDHILKDKGKSEAKNNYYHLDCIMQPLPDGRLIILNKDILSPSSQKLLTTIFKEKLINLAYKNYITKPVMFNFITIPNEADNNFSIICPTFPSEVTEALFNLNLYVITPECLDYRDKYFNKALTTKVVESMKKEGFDLISETNLPTHLTRNINGYLLDNDKKLDKASQEKIFTENPVRVDPSLKSEKTIKFVYGGGGPHCFTLDIKPVTELKQPLKEPRSKPSFFKKQTYAKVCQDRAYPKFGR